jgi:beta-ribofuranosylaminobenzene 5'-phosphate synthase
MAHHLNNGPTLRIRTPSRLTFGLIDMNGELGRVEGGLGLALDEPRVELRARRARAVRIGGAEVSSGTRAKLEELCARFAREHRAEGIDLTIERVIPSHCGLGSGTQLMMAAGLALGLLYDVKLTGRQLAVLGSRGGTSGIGVAAFDRGGFLADGGHRFGGAGGKTVFAPSAASAGFEPPPLLFHSPLPANWRVLLALPAGRITYGDEERALFRQICPVPSEEAAQGARLALLKVLPALLEGDLSSFGDGIEAMQQLGFKRHQIARQSKAVHETMAQMRRLGLRGVGMSSWGPALFGFSDAGPEADRATVAALASFGAERGGVTVLATGASERGTTWSWE